MSYQNYVSILSPKEVGGRYYKYPGSSPWSTPTPPVEVGPRIVQELGTSVGTNFRDVK